ncbi:peptidoglycan editing factor PgeF [Methylomonas sp. AM2-LC]|uniref:peptidoglycan editing factor PgeF n=1 Tax=Methylomonas sp. AM2-LC TaxID=3153301 RepID=UPI003262E285
MNWIKPDWPLPAHIHAAVTLRSGGVSVGAFSTLNPATHVNDYSDHVNRNREIIKEMLQLPSEPVWLQQVHGVRVIKADTVNGLECADASYTDQPGVVCAILTADCLPVLFCGDGGRVVAAAHAGWRGLQAGILSETFKQMNCQSVLAWLGPAIGPRHFEVGEAVYNAFVDDSAVYKTAFQAISSGKWLADIYQLARIQLNHLGVKQIYGGGLCTVTDAARFYSYRRDGAVTGRMASLIWSSKS